MYIQKIFTNIISSQKFYESKIRTNIKKYTGAFFTNNLEVIDNIIDIIKFDDNIVNKKILEPSCGQGIFLLKIIANLYEKSADKGLIYNLIENSLIFIDIDDKMLEITKLNIKNFYNYLFGEAYTGNFNCFSYDFTKKLNKSHCTLFENFANINPLEKYLGKIDYVIGNPPYVTLYGRRDKKINEEQRIYYLNNYRQFPTYIKNGKINYVMLFLEHSFDFMREGGLLSFIIDISFFETAFLYTRKYLLENANIISIDYNITEFDVTSGQLILKLKKSKPQNNNKVKLFNVETGQIKHINQSTWYKPDDEYKFRINQCDVTKKIINKIVSKRDKSLKDLYPKKNLRTCTMLLNMEDKFTSNNGKISNNVKAYPYYQGSKSLKEKFGELSFTKYFHYDKHLQDKINNELKIELRIKGVKNKKRIGLGETIVYDNPKVYIRQSAKEIIATYDEKNSSANNSLYIFTLRSDTKETRQYLKFLCGFLNSDLVTFYAQKTNIIRYLKGKQPQIKVSDLYTIKILSDTMLQEKIAEIVSNIYAVKSNKENLIQSINKIIFNYYNISDEETNFIKNNIKFF